jgi:DNA adenine methylase|tara:strand:+ start:1257 stop:2129 length:873 start_codon:yes stop_codon:yes gene_type:complete
MKSHKTPLRYPGGKSRACTKIGQFLPNMYTYREFREPFLGGGSVAIYLTKMYPSLSIWVNDLYEPLVNFWKEVQHSGEELYTTLSDLKIKHPNPDSAKGLFLESKEIINSQDKSKLERAVAFYVVNKCSFSGLTESSSFSAQASDSNFSMRGIEKLTGYQEIIEDWKITNLSYEDLLTDWKDTFIYLDPPYDIKDNLYGKSGEMHKKFDHDKFAKDCDDHTADMMISYNSSQLIKNRFKDWNAVEFDLTYTMRSVGDYMSDQQARKELLLLNYGTQGMVEVDQFVKEESY